MACVKAHITMMPPIKALISKVSSELSIGISRVATKLCLSVDRPIFVAKANLLEEKLKTEIANVTPSIKVSCDLFCDLASQYYLKVTPKEEQWIYTNAEYNVLSNTDWLVTTNADWMQLRKGNNNVMVSAFFNDGLDRGADISFVGGGLIVTRKVMQEGMREVFSEDFILAEGGTFNVLKA